MISIRIDNNTFDTDYKYVNKKNSIIFYEKPINKNTFYTIIKYNKTKKRLSFIQDDIGDLKQYYYSIIDNCLVIDTSISKIMEQMDKKKFDNSSLYYFLSCGFIPSEKTLIDGIYKVVPGFINSYDVRKKKCILKKKKLIGNSFVFSIKKYKKLLLNNINKNVDKIIETGFAISSGYDSNLLISLSEKNNHSSKNFFCIGAKKGVNEIPVVERILKNYNVKYFYNSIVDYKTFNNFPKIVYLYEGLFYERGIFLQYELYKLTLNKKINLILGEGADQILHCNAKKNNNLNYFIKQEKFSLYKNCPLDMLNYIVLKKSSLLLSKTSNNIIYPYLYNNFRKYNYNFGFLFKYDKKIHKHIVKEEVDKNIENLLCKIGGATDQCSLYKDELEYKKIKEIALNSKFSNIYCEHNKTELSLDDDYILKLIYLIIFEKIFINNNYDNIDFDNLTLDNFLN